MPRSARKRGLPSGDAYTMTTTQVRAHVDPGSGKRRVTRVQPNESESHDGHEKEGSAAKAGREKANGKAAREDDQLRAANRQEDGGQKGLHTEARRCQKAGGEGGIQKQTKFRSLRVSLE
jgi:hypothetical protein